MGLTWKYRASGLTFSKGSSNTNDDKEEEEEEEEKDSGEETAM